MPSVEKAIVKPDSELYVSIPIQNPSCMATNLPVPGGYIGVDTTNKYCAIITGGYLQTAACRPNSREAVFDESLPTAEMQQLSDH